MFFVLLGYFAAWFGFIQAGTILSFISKIDLLIVKDIKIGFRFEINGKLIDLTFFRFLQALIKFYSFGSRSTSLFLIN